MIQQFPVKEPAGSIPLLYLQRAQLLPRQIPGPRQVPVKMAAVREPVVEAARAQLGAEKAVPIQGVEAQPLLAEGRREPGHQRELRAVRKAAGEASGSGNRSGSSDISLLPPVPGSSKDPLSPDVHTSDRL